MEEDHHRIDVSGGGCCFVFCWLLVVLLAVRGVAWRGPVAAGANKAERAPPFKKREDVLFTP